MTVPKPKQSTLLERRQKKLRIDTQRTEVCGGETAEKRDRGLAGEYVQRHRQKRQRQGEAYMKRSVSVFALSFLGVMRFRQYSHLYYACWVSTYLSFFLTLPSVLPTDNTKIVSLLAIGLGNISTAAVFCASKALEKHRGSCDFAPVVCAWNVCFWSFQAAGATAMSFVFLHAATRLQPRAALYRFWKATGLYFLFVSSVTSFDLFLSYRAGKYDAPDFVWAGRWNVVISLEQALLGCLSLSHRFKNFIWAYAASFSSINVRDERHRDAAVASDHTPHRVHDSDDDGRLRAKTTAGETTAGVAAASSPLSSRTRRPPTRPIYRRVWEAVLALAASSLVTKRGAADAAETHVAKPAKPAPFVSRHHHHSRPRRPRPLVFHAAPSSS
mmetsp:Transcript_25050/g.77327  ORF Transcript_25050/g.77327 Transcript_25050/m.77327 type:complete len:385 (+) Transcript_25050:166-1320(+)